MSVWLAARLVTFARVYFTLLFGWAILHALFGDRWAWLFLLNSFAAYLFLPLAAILPLAFAARRRDIWLGTIIAGALAVTLFGGLFLPKLPTGEAASALSVMSYNMLGFNEHADAVIATIRAANADVIAIQELNPRAATALRRDLARDYPYQILAPQEGVTGMGVISRYPLRVQDEALPGTWVGAPQVLTLEWRGNPVTLLHVHTLPTNFPLGAFFRETEVVEWTIREREQQAREIARFATAHPTRLIVAGDFNLTDQNVAYGIIAGALVDAWRARGWGQGHTFPGGNLAEGTRPTLARLPMPMWLVRIDYIFHSRDWQTVSADLGAWDGFSDHRPIIVGLALTK